MSLIASGVGLPPDLAQTLSTFGNNAYNKIGQNYGAAAGKSTFDNSMGGPIGGVTDYQKQRLGATQGLDVGNLEASLGGGLGNTAYKDTLAQRDYQQQQQLADLIGNAMKPSTLEEIMQGIGGAAGAGAQLAPFMSSMMPKASDPMAGVYGNV